MSEHTLANTAASLPSRTLDEIKISIRLHSGQAAQSILQIGRDLIEAKSITGHGGWLPFLREIGYSASTAENWMRLSREIQPDSSLAGLPYTKALALLALPQDERETFAQENEVDSKSAAQIRKLIEERNRAAEAANAETNRANEAEKKLRDTHGIVEQMERNCDYYKTQADLIEKERKDWENRCQALARELERKCAEPDEIQIKTVEIVKPPADYEEMKNRLKWADQNVDDALDAATQAQQRADDLAAQLAALQAQDAGNRHPDGVDALAQAINDFISATQLMAVNPGPLARREKETEALFKRLKLFILDLEKAVSDAAFAAEGAVV